MTTNHYLLILKLNNKEKKSNEINFQVKDYMSTIDKLMSYIDF